MEKFLFQINFKSFGPVKNAKIKLCPLTIFVGPNNTGKTYVAYFIWSLVSTTFFSLVELLDPPADAIEYLRDNFFHPLKKTKQAKVDLLAFIKQGYLESFFKDYVKTMSDLFFRTIMQLNIQAKPEVEIEKVNEKAIENKLKSFELKSDKMQFGEIELTVQKSGKDSSVNFTIDKPINRRVFRRGSKKEKQVLSDLYVSLMIMLRYLVLEGAMVIPAERTALTFAYKDIYQSRAEATFRDKFRSEKFSRYPYPITNFLDFMYNVLESPVTDYYKEAVEHIETNIISGEIELHTSKGVPIPSIYYSFYKEPSDIKMEIHGASSGVKALASLLLYLRRARPQDLLVIDEPEINLHPEAQLKLLEALNMAVNKGLYVIITTHTPYIVDYLTNLMKGYILSQKGEEFKKKVQEFGLMENALISPDKVSVYWFKEDGTVEDILDRENAFVDWRTFSEVTEKLEKTAFWLEELEYEDDSELSGS